MARKRTSGPKRAGTFCWSCGFNRPNEAFSGSGRTQHLCRDCQKLGADELVFRQAERDIEQLLRWDLPIIPRRKHQAFERFLQHSDERVRRYAERLLVDHRRERAMLRAISAQQDGAYEAMMADIERSGTETANVEAPTGQVFGTTDACDLCAHDDCIPF